MLEASLLDIGTVLRLEREMCGLSSSFSLWKKCIEHKKAGGVSRVGIRRTVLLLEKDAWSMVKRLESSNKRVPPSPLHATRRTPHGTSRLMHAMSAWSVKTRRAASRHSRDARVMFRRQRLRMKRAPPPNIVLPWCGLSLVVFMVANGSRWEGVPRLRNALVVTVFRGG